MKALFALLVVLLVLPAAAAAEDGGGNDGKHDEARARVACAGGRAELRLQADDEEMIEVELRLEGRPGIQPVRIVILHERRIAYQAPRKTNRLGALRLRLALADWPGNEAIVARIGLPSGRTCVLEATI